MRQETCAPDWIRGNYAVNNGWVNEQQMFIFGWIIPLASLYRVMPCPSRVRAVSWCGTHSAQRWRRWSTRRSAEGTAAPWWTASADSRRHAAWGSPMETCLHKTCAPVRDRLPGKHTPVNRLQWRNGHRNNTRERHRQHGGLTLTLVAAPGIRRTPSVSKPCSSMWAISWKTAV